MTEFAASIKLDSRSASEQMRKFSNVTGEASKSLKKLQEETKKTTQGLGDNIFRKYINSARKADVAMENSISKIHDQSKAFKKLTDSELELVLVADKLNRKYDETARNELKLKVIKNDLRKVTAAGLKTQKEANIILNREAKLLDESTIAFKQNAAAKKKASKESEIAQKKLNKEYAESQARVKALNKARKTEVETLRKLKAKYDVNYAVMIKIRKARKELNLLLRKGIIDNKQYNSILAKQSKILKTATIQSRKMADAQFAMAKAARLVSVASRIWLGLYTVGRLGTFIKDLEVTAEKIDLLTQKLEFLTGDAGAYKKLFDMTQDVGIEMDAANKIITRFAVVTNKAFSIETMNEWSSTLIRSARATGTSTQEMSGALIQITQAMSAGRLMGDEYRSVTENLPLLTVALRDMFKDSTLSLKELSSQGLLTNDVMVEAFGKLNVLLEGFPDSTDTTTAAIGRLSSAWDNFVSKAGNTKITKNILNFLSQTFNDISDKIDSNKENDDFKAILNGFKKAVIIEKNIIAEEERLLNLISKARKDKDSFYSGMTENQINISQKRLADLNIQLIANRKESRILRGATAEDNAKKAALAAAKIEEKRDAARKEELKTEKLIESVLQRKANLKVRDAFNIKREKISAKVNRFDGGKAGGIPFEQELVLLEVLAKQEKDTIDKKDKTFIDAQLRSQGLMTDFNDKELKRKSVFNDKILVIEQKFADENLRIRSSLQSRIEGLAAGQSPDKLKGATGEEAKKLFEEADTRKLSEIETVVKTVTNSIDKMGSSARQTTAVLNKDSLGILKFKKESILDDFTSSVIVLEDKIKSLAGRNLDLTEKYKSQLKALKDLKSAQLLAADRDLDEGLENQFNDQAVAARNFDKSTKDLNLTLDRGLVSIEQYRLKSSELTREYENLIMQSKALEGSVGQLEQVYAGINKGVFDFKDNTMTAFEITAQSTERLFDAMATSIVIGGNKGKEAFADMTKSILADIQKMIIKSLILKGIGAFGFNFGGSSVVTTDAGSSYTDLVTNAKGGTFSGPGISSYSNSVVSKPTLFPFAKGTGIMGEAGDEAIMPLTRLPNGDLGVGAAKGDSGSIGGININVSVDNKGNAEQDVSGSGGGQELGIVLSAAVQQQLIKEMRPGGILNRRG